MSTSKKIVLLFVLILILTTGYLILNTKSAQKNTKPERSTTISPSYEDTQWKTYTNTKYGYTVPFPISWRVQEFPDTKSGANFIQNETTVVTSDIAYTASNPPYPTLEEFAKTAATQQIQNYEKLNSIETVTTKDGAVGYKTTWIVGSPPILNPPKDYQPSKSISSPITYFSIPSDDGLLLMFSISSTSPTEEQIEIYNKMIESVVLKKE